MEFYTLRPIPQSDRIYCKVFSASYAFAKDRLKLYLIKAFRSKYLQTVLEYFTKIK